MTKRLDCVIEGCHATIEGESEEAVMARAGAHAEEEHPELDLNEETIETIRSAIQDV